MINHVFYDDTDCGGVVYHARYFMFCERARSLIFFTKNILPVDGDSGFVVKRIESDFISALSLGDRYEVKTTPLSIKNVSVILQQQIFKIGTINEILQTPELVFSMQVQLAYINMITKKPCKITDEFKSMIV